MTSSHPYKGQRASLATRHEKWELVAPAMDELIGLAIINIDVDTDALGTFSGDIARVGTPLETAIAKARLGMTASGLSIGIASEGTIGAHPSLPFVVSDVELVVLVDDVRGIVISDSDTELAVPAFTAEISPHDCDSLVLEDAGFPEHGLIVKPSVGSSPIIKGIHDRESLGEAVWRCHRESGSDTVVVQSDFRAHHHPTRRLVIERAARRLAARVASLCPACATPGWGIVRHEIGSLCSECRTPTTQVRAEVFACVACTHEASRDVSPVGGTSPLYCPRCNP